MKKIFLALIAALLCFASDFLPPDEAFKASVASTFSASEFRIDLADEIYLYKDRLRVVLDGEEISAHIDEQGDFAVHEGERVFFHYLSFLLPDFMGKERLEIDFQGCSSAGLCYQPMRAKFIKSSSGWQHTKTELAKPAGANGETDEIDDGSAFSEQKFISALENGGFWGTLALFAGFGVLLSFTPCVLPMLPILSSILAKKSGSFAFISSAVYVLFMALAYAALGVLAALAGGSFAAFLQQDWLQLAFALLFVLLALSCFGLFELALPQKLQDFARLGDRAPGLMGAALMGVLSALLVGPCVAAPLAGALVYIASSHDVVLGGAALFALALGMGVPLLALGAGFSLLKTSSQMAKINRFFGFLLLGVAVFFARNSLGDAGTFVAFGLILCAFAADFELIKAAKSAKEWAQKCFVIALCAAGFFILHKEYSHDFAVHTSAAVLERGGDFGVDFRRVQNASELDIKAPSVLYFTAKWCENCQIYHDEVFPAAAKELGIYDLFMIDLTNPSEFERQMAKNYQVFGPPVLIILDKSGKILRKITGLIDAKTLKNILNQAKS